MSRTNSPNYSVSNFLATPTPEDVAIQIYDIRGAHKFSLDPYITTFYAKDKFIYIIVENKKTYNNLLDFCNSGEADQALILLNEAKKYLMYKGESGDCVTFAQLSGYTGFTYYYTTAEIDNILSGLTISSNTYTGPATIDVGGIHSGDDFVNVNMQDMWYQLLNPVYSPTATISGGGNKEHGDSATTLSISWTATKRTYSLTGVWLDGVSVWNGSGTTQSGVDAVDIVPDTNKTIYLTISDSDGNGATGSTSLQYLNKRYWGINSGTSVTSTDILALSSEFATNYLKTFTLNGEGKYLYYCYPASFGYSHSDPTYPQFKVNGFINTAWSGTTQSFTNSKGYSESYIVFRTTTVQFGTGILIEKI